MEDNDGELPTEDGFKKLAANELNTAVAVAETAARLWRKLVGPYAPQDRPREDALKQAELPDYAPVDLSTLRPLSIVDGVAVPLGLLKKVTGFEETASTGRAGPQGPRLWCWPGG